MKSDRSVSSQLGMLYIQCVLTCNFDSLSVCVFVKLTRCQWLVPSPLNSQLNPQRSVVDFLSRVHHQVIRYELKILYNVTTNKTPVFHSINMQKSVTKNGQLYLNEITLQIAKARITDTAIWKLDFINTLFNHLSIA